MLQFTTSFGEQNGRAERLFPCVTYHGNDAQMLFLPKSLQISQIFLIFAPSKHN